jgi:hypothetical protein
VEQSGVHPGDIEDIVVGNVLADQVSFLPLNEFATYQLYNYTHRQP